MIFNALIIIALIPLALRGVPYRPKPAAQLLRDNLLIYGLGGLIAPFIGIKLIDMLLTWLQYCLGGPCSQNFSAKNDSIMCCISACQSWLHSLGHLPN